VEIRDDAREEKDHKHVEALKVLLQPSAAPQDRIDEIKRELVTGKHHTVVAIELPRLITQRL